MQPCKLGTFLPKLQQQRVLNNSTAAMHDAPLQWLCSNCETIPCPYLTSSAAARRRSLRLWVHQVSWFFVLLCDVMINGRNTGHDYVGIRWAAAMEAGGDEAGFMSACCSLKWAGLIGCHSRRETMLQPDCGGGQPVLRLWDDELIFLGLLGFWVDGWLSARKKKGFYVWKSEISHHGSLSL